jgi:multisubunit Na+/H+ antiporter MnhE subunit
MAMILWLRLAGASALIAVVVGLLDYYGVLSLAGDQSTERAEETAHRVRELFWQLIFLVVMATAVWSAARRVTERVLRRA